MIYYASSILQMTVLSIPIVDTFAFFDSETYLIL